MNNEEFIPTTTIVLKEVIKRKTNKRKRMDPQFVFGGVSHADMLEYCRRDIEFCIKHGLVR